MVRNDVTTTISGSDVMSSCARYSASRVAFPPTNWAVTAPAQTIAVTRGGDHSDRDDGITDGEPCRHRERPERRRPPHAQVVAATRYRITQAEVPRRSIQRDTSAKSTLPPVRIT